MKRCVLVLMIALLAGQCLPGSVQARGDAAIANTVHNMSSSSPDELFRSQDEDQICVFCHTPHGGSLTGPLWNRSNVSGTWTHYNSASLSSQITSLGVNRALSDESMLCMSCHDGSIAINSLLVPPKDNTDGIDGPSGGDYYVGDRPGLTNGPRIGGGVTMTEFRDLSDDHPVSFSYKDVIENLPYSAGGSKEGHLRDLGPDDGSDTATAQGWLGEGVAFFGGDYRVECSSCHDPHVDYIAQPEYDPFLIRNNSDSNLCFACHIK